MSLLDDLLRLQSEIRALEQLDQDVRLKEGSSVQSLGGLKDPGENASTRGSSTTAVGSWVTADGTPFQSTSGASNPLGTEVATSGNKDLGHAMWGDMPKNIDPPALTDVPCRNSPNCYADPPCYGDHDCGPCEMCLNWECVDKDWNRPCEVDIDCPCPPNEDQKFVCVQGACQLTCEQNDDCGVLGSGGGGVEGGGLDEDGNPLPEEPHICFACNPATGYCGPGCTTDESCIPGDINEAADSKPGSYCIDCSCLTPCEAPRFCKSSSECEEGEYCAEHFGRAPGDPSGSTHSCTPGCDESTGCEVEEIFRRDEVTGADVLVVRRQLRCVDNDCMRWCNDSSECLETEVCDENECTEVGSICVANSDCEDGKYCNADGRCTSGCYADHHCDETCPRSRECVDRCRIDPNCTCQEIDGVPCEEGNYEWMDYCPKDPACIADCPFEEDCEEDYSQTCVANKCVRACTSEQQCGEGYSCSYIDDENPSLGKECVAATTGEPGEVDDRFGCDCGECCTQAGQCEPCICIDDTDCESCSYCKKGVCVPGCDDENPCPSGECCQSDGKCHLICEHDRDCPQKGYHGGPEQCLEGGCCGLACDLLIPCTQQNDCKQGQFCNIEGYCEDGCRIDEHCTHVWPDEEEVDEERARMFCYQQNCELSCISSGDCGEDEVCNSDGFCIGKDAPPCRNDNECEDRESTDENGNVTIEKSYCFDGKCSSGCRSGGDCKAGQRCVDKQCKTPCSTNQDCKIAGAGNTCQGDPEAESAASRSWKKCLAQLQDLEDDIYTPNWIVNEKKEECSELEENARNAAGYCADVEGPPDSPEGRSGCECWETCDELGRCVPDPCENDSDCDACGASCLTSRTLDQYYPPKTGRFCGLCYSDDDCPGRSVCDQPTECDENGENCTVEIDPDTGKEVGGQCAYTCIPEDPCESNEDCPPGNFCLVSTGVCQQGCQDSSECIPGEVCVDGKCRQNCSNGCPEGHSCLRGGCVYTGFPCGDDGDCPPELGYCKGGRCEVDNRCDFDADCGTGETDKCVNGFCNERSEDPFEDQFSESITIGCEACTDFCNPQKFLCEATPCITDVDCPCGFCSAQGVCIEECKSDAECRDQGFCIEGACYECKQDYHCRARYEAGLLADGDNFEGEEGYEWADQLVCKDFMCETPCGDSLSDGNCYAGLSYGEDCSSCPDKCPTGAQCVKTESLDSVAKKWDPISQDWHYYPLKREECVGFCSCDSDCVGDTYCIDGKCQQDMPKCNVDADCPGRKAPTACAGEDCCEDDTEFRCFENQCREVGDACIQNSDCEPGWLCDFGACVEGECTDEEGCPGGQVCSGGTCRNQCDTEPMACGLVPIIVDNIVVGQEELKCPPGYNCDVNVCISKDYIGLGERMGCGQGSVCVDGGCRPKVQGVWECAADEHCQEAADRAAYGYCITKEKRGTKAFWDCVNKKRAESDHFCEENLCKVGKAPCKCEDGTTNCEECRPKEDPPADQGTPCQCPESNPDCFQCQDACQKIGKCCNDQGFCEQCLCDEDHPCDFGECCDPETGKCHKRSEHKDTKYGAPHECKFGEVFCEVVDPEDNPFRPSTDFQDSSRLPGCETEQVCNQRGECVDVKRCYDGRPLSEGQIINLLDQACRDPKDDCDCKEDEPPAFNECYTDEHCGSCQECITKEWKGTDCCPRYDSYLADNGEVVETNVVRRNICKGKLDHYPDGKEREKKEAEKCACLTDDDCSDCEVCVTDGLFLGDREGYCKKDCSRCPAGGSTSVDGDDCPSCEDQHPCLISEEFVLEEEYVDEQGNLVPAETRSVCVVDRANPCCERWETPEQVLQATGHGCLRKSYITANGETRILQTETCRDYEKGECAECEVDADCRGTQRCMHHICVSPCGMENSAAMEQSALADTAQDILGAFDPQDCSCCTEGGECKEIFESWTEGQQFGDTQYCRPCSCTEGGIDCQAWNKCESCYQWVREDGKGRPDSDGTSDAVIEAAEQHATQLQLEDAIYTQQAEIVQQQEQIALEQEASQQCWRDHQGLAENLDELCEGCCRTGEEACCDAAEGCPDCGSSECASERLEYNTKKNYREQLQEEINAEEEVYEAIFGELTQCPQVQICPPEPECFEDAQCGAGEICECDKCIDQHCLTDTDCSEGECVNGRCLVNGEYNAECEEEEWEGEVPTHCCRWNTTIPRDEKGRITELPEDTYPNNWETGQPEEPCNIGDAVCGELLVQLTSQQLALAGMYDQLDTAWEQENEAKRALDECGGDGQSACDEAKAEYEGKANECRGYDDNIATMETNLAAMADNLETMQAKLLGLPTGHLSWRQERICDCCIDGQCREDVTDCAYGTCYMCPSQWVREREPCYGIGFHGKVLKNLICMGMNSTMLGRERPPECDDPEAECPPPLYWEGKSCHCSECPSEINDCARVPNPGTNFIYYDEDPDQCIKYRCADGLQRVDSLPVCWDQRYREYCKGSIISCALQGAGSGYPDNVAGQYLNGWEFGCDDLSKAGIWYGNASSGPIEIDPDTLVIEPDGDTGQWIRFSGPTKKDHYAMCAYPNRMGHIRGHELPTFIDDLAAHPCCNHGITLVGAHDDTPGCTLTFEYFFESGDTSALLDRLRKEMDALGNYIGELLAVWDQLMEGWKLIDNQMLELRQEILDISIALEEATERLEELRKDKEDLEKDLKELNEKIENTCDLEPIGQTCTFTHYITPPDCEMVKDERTGNVVKECNPDAERIEIPYLPWNPCITEHRDGDEVGLEQAVEIFDNERQVYGDIVAGLTEARDGYQQELNETGCGELQAEHEELKRLFSQKEQECLDEEAQVKAALNNMINCPDINTGQRPIPSTPPYCCRCSATTGRDPESGRLVIVDDLCPVDDEGNSVDPIDADTVGCFDELAALDLLMEKLYESYDARDDLGQAITDKAVELGECNGDSGLLAANIELKNEEIEYWNGKYDKAADEQGCMQAQLDEAYGERKSKQEELLALNKEIETLENQVEELSGEGNVYDCYWEITDYVCDKIETGALEERMEQLDEVRFEAEQAALEICGCHSKECTGGTNWNTQPEEDPWECEWDYITNLSQCCSGEIAIAWDEWWEKKHQYDRLAKEYNIPVVPVTASYEDAKGGDNKSAAELRKWIKELQEADKKASQNVWYPE